MGGDDARGSGLGLRADLEAERRSALFSSSTRARPFSSTANRASRCWMRPRRVFTYSCETLFEPDFMVSRVGMLDPRMRILPSRFFMRQLILFFVL